MGQWGVIKKVEERGGEVVGGEGGVGGEEERGWGKSVRWRDGGGRGVLHCVGEWFGGEGGGVGVKVCFYLMI